MKKFTLVMISSLVSFKALAWGELGHSSIGHIAEMNLTPQGKQFVQDILGEEPMAVAAMWPDTVRSDARFDSFAEYHFFEIREGYTYGKNPEELKKEKSADVIVSQAKELLLARKKKKRLSRRSLVME